MNTHILDTSQIRDITSDVIGPDGRPLLLPAAYWATTTRPERALVGHRHGVYTFPTVELVEHLRAVIAGRPAIEIGAGNGVIAEALGIVATDNRMQEKTPYREHYAATRQPPVRYGPNVVDLPAAAAVREYRPHVVVGCWITHLYDPARPEAGGNEIGVDEDDIIDHCETYILVGNDNVHRDKTIWRRNHRIERPTFVYSRAYNGTRDFVATWANPHWTTTPQ